MSDAIEPTVNDVLNLFNSIDSVLDVFGMKDPRQQAPGTVADELAKLFGAMPDSDAVLTLYSKLSSLHAYASIMLKAPAVVGRVRGK